MLKAQAQIVAPLALPVPAEQPLTPEEVYSNLRKAFDAAMAAGQLAVAADIVKHQTKMMGMVIERSAVAVGTPDQFRNQAEEQQHIYDAVERKYGPGGVRRSREFVREVRAMPDAERDGRLIEHREE